MAEQSYDRTAKAFHWLMAAMILGLVAVGAVMVELPKGAWRADLHSVHKQVGVAVLLLVGPRLVYRLWRGVPSLPDGMPRWEQVMAKVGHWGLYAMMLLVPISGIVMSQAGDHPVQLLGWVLPTVIEPDKDWHELFEDAHGLLAYTTLALVVGHAGAALRHHFILKDQVLARMLPSWIVKI